MNIDYTHKSLVEAYQKIGVESGRTVYITGNFGCLGRYEHKDKNQLLSEHLSVLQELIGESGTLIVPTHSWSLCNTNIPFDINKTESETGAFTEFVRNQKGAVRQFHPFSSSTALGRSSNYYCTNNSSHVYGVCSPFQRMIDADALYVSVGLPLERTISLVHHVELVMGVPYRYVKEFLHPCVVENKIIIKPFYLYVTNNKCGLIRDKNKKIMQNFREKYQVKKQILGRSFVEALGTQDFYQETTKLFSKDIFSWLKEPPEYPGYFRK